ncbi:MAG: Fic family protein [Oscillospiraceae bacterium]|nr:Fic family protein [Oscillospiraceae bacterium]
MQVDNQYTQLLKKQLIYDMNHQKRNGIYGYMQRTMAYNSNRIEGSTLTAGQTASIFETGTIDAEKDVIYRTKDIEEMTGHFRMFNQTLQRIDEMLSEEIIKQMHYNLKVGVFEDTANGYPCGEYKNRENFVSDIKTTLPENVSTEIKELLKWYNNIKTPTVADLAEFHAKYESIHPFQDGNGRTGRMILFRESVKYNMVPIIIRDDDKNQYRKYLNQAQKYNDFKNLVQFFEEQQEQIYKETKGIVIPK